MAGGGTFPRAGLRPLAILARYAATHRPDDAARARLALHLADAVIAWQAGVRTGEGRRLASLLGADALPALIRHTEIDDIERNSGVTAAAIVVPAALQGQASADEFCAALAVGYELALRRSEAAGGAALLAQGVWPSYLVAPFGAAAAAGRSLALPEDQMENALALATARSARRVGRGSGRWVLFAQAVRDGCMAARAAQAGYGGDRDLFSEELSSALARPLEESAVFRLSIKPHCSAKQALAAIHALQTLLRRGIAKERIERIEVAVPTAYRAMLEREPPTASRLASMVNVRYQLALAVLHPELLDDVSREPARWSPTIESWMARIDLLGAPELDRHYPRHWPARVAVHAEGRRHEITVLDSPGDSALAFGRAEIEDKARRVLGETGLRLVGLAFAACENDDALARLRDEMRSVMTTPSP